MKIETTRKDWKKTISYLTVYIATIVTGAFLLLPIYWYIWVIIIVLGMIFLVLWHSKTSIYHCINCGNEFKASI